MGAASYVLMPIILRTYTTDALMSLGVAGNETDGWTDRASCVRDVGEGVPCVRNVLENDEDYDALSAKGKAGMCAGTH